MNAKTASTTYEQALTEAQTAGAVHAGDAQLMAMFCHNNLQTLIGAVSPRLVWEGAQKRGLSMDDLARMCADEPGAVADLMWL